MRTPQAIVRTLPPSSTIHSMPLFTIVRSLLKPFFKSDAETVSLQSESAEGSAGAPEQNQESGPIRENAHGEGGGATLVRRSPIVSRVILAE